MKSISFFALALALFSLFLVGCSSMEQADTPNESLNTSTEAVSPDGQYVLVPSKSTMKWEGGKITDSHDGVIQISEGELTVQNNKLSGNFVVDMNTIQTTDGAGEGLDKHLKNEDFFDVGNHPTAKFVITGSEKKKNFYSLTGDLTIKGITHPITFDTTFTEQGEALRAQADFTIDRTLWDIRYGSGKFFENLGDKAIKDEIEFKLDLVFQKA